MKVSLTFSPIDINIQFIVEEGWSQADRLCFYFERKLKIRKDHPLTFLLNLKPHILIRRCDQEEDCFIAIFVTMNGEIELFSNDREFARKYLQGLFLNCPPSYHSVEELEFIEEGWIVDKELYAMFLGLLHGALGTGLFTFRFLPPLNTHLKRLRKRFQ